MKLGLINSAWLGTAVGTAEGIRKTKEIGFDSIDIFNDPMDIDIKERRLIKDTCREVGLPVISHCCCALGIADFKLAAVAIAPLGKDIVRTDDPRAFYR